MQTVHIHIGGLVQGVGFRPHVYRLARQMGITGTVANTNNGVHIIATGEGKTLDRFYRQLTDEAPAHAVITHRDMVAMPLRIFDGFTIMESEGMEYPDLLVTPDLALCDDCRAALHSKKDRRYQYPFTTCTHCGPRYSILRELPYDRERTTMRPYEPCEDCRKEYEDPSNTRYYSQTNSCRKCGIPMRLYNADGEMICEDYACILQMARDAIRNGHILAVKGIGGYLLMADATNVLAVATLRERKHRPSKPFAVLYPTIAMARKDVKMTETEQEALRSAAAPIVLCQLQEEPGTGLCTRLVAPGLLRVGVMLPYSALLELLADACSRPLIATSGNLSGSPIIYEDAMALESFSDVADFVLAYDREIVVPQDDSVVQYSPRQQQRIVLRRSRGMAPNLFPDLLKDTGVPAIAMGAELKSSFAIQAGKRAFVSQYLGDQSTYESQLAFRYTMQHLSDLLHFQPARCISDMHPGYHTTLHAREYADTHQAEHISVQHHKAHFAAVLAENGLMESDDPVLGVIWDGSGYGEDGNIWGSEFLSYHKRKMNRICHLDYFPVLAGDKMAREPRLSALSLCFTAEDCHDALYSKFSQTEWNYYQKQLATEKYGILSCGMGRFLDAVACLLGLQDVSSYEGEAAMRLEAAAWQSRRTDVGHYPLVLSGDTVFWSRMFFDLVQDLQEELPVETIALKVHLSLVKLVEAVALRMGVSRIAFSGGVFQNALLADLLVEELQDRYQLYFHRQLSPNDENIAFGQLAYVNYVNDKNQTHVPGNSREDSFHHHRAG